MDKSDKLDKTKENIGVSNLDDTTRKKLFEKFVDSGGEVIDDRNKRKNIIIDRERQRQFQQKLEKQSKTNDKKYPKKSQIKTSSAVKKTSDTDTAVLSNFLTRFKLKLKLKFLGITNFSGSYFNTKFLKKFNNVYKPALMEMQIIYLEIFRKNPSLGRRIAGRLDNDKPLYYELIEKTGNLFDKILIDQIVEHYINYPEIPNKVSELKEPLMELYKRLYILHQYDNSIVHSFNRSIDYYVKMEEEDIDISSHTMKRKIRNSVFIVFHKLFPRMHLLFCFFHGNYFEYFDSRIEKIISITENEKPGKRKANQFSETPTPEQDESNEAQQDEKEDKTEDPKSKAIRKGLEIMMQLDLVQLRREFDKGRLFDHVSEGDKVLITFILFNEFDKEYSFILTTNKIKFFIDFGDRTMTDFRSKLNGLYDEMRACSTLLKQYAEELISYERARREKPSGSSQYIEFTKRLESLEKKKNSVGKNALLAVKDFMKKVSGELELLIEDMDGVQNYVQNPQDVLEFETHIEGDKKINGKKVYEAINLVYCFTLAFESRLGPGGDLSGELEFNEEELKSMKKETSQKKPESEKKETTSKESILDELEDML